MANNEYMNANDRENLKFSIGVPEIICWILANIFGVLNQYISWLAIFLNMFFALAVGIITLILINYKSMAKSSGPAAHNANFLLTNVVCGKKYNSLLVFCVWLVGILIVATEIGIVLTTSDFVFSLDINFDTITMVLNSVFTILTACFLALSVRKIGKQR